MIKYRIKTKQEFIDEFGERWRTMVRFHFTESMNHLLGVEVDIPIYDNILIPNIFLGWNISTDMLIELKKKIDYNTPRKLIYD